MMDRQYRQLEGRLDEMLSRIAMETEEIKDLEQQLTEGQIAANEALKRDLEGIISGLQEYLESVKGQARQAHHECRELQAERELLLRRLEELEEERQRLEAATQEGQEMKKEVEDLQHSLREQHASLQQAQGDLSAYEERMQARDAEIAQLKQELERRQCRGQAEAAALEEDLQRERHALGEAKTKARMLEESEQCHNRLLSELQKENESLKKQLRDAEMQLRDTLQSMVHPDHIATRMSELKRKLQTGVGEIRPSGRSDILGQNLAELQQQISSILGKSEEEKREARERQRKLQGEVAALNEEVAALQEEVVALQEKAREAPGEYKKAAEAQVQQERRQSNARVQQLNEQLKSMEEIQGLAEQQLLEADEERERLLAELHDLESEKKAEDARAQKRLSTLDQELRELKRAMASSDKLATSELTHTKDQLRSLHGTVLQINRERAEEVREAGSFCAQAAHASRDLAKAEAEIELLQELLQEKERQLREETQNADKGAANSQQLEIDKLKQTLQRQRAEIERLRHTLDHMRADNAGEIGNLLEEIDSLRSALGYQSDYITSMAEPFRRRGYWYYLPASANNSGRDSLSTKDSGISVHYPMTSSPARRKSGPRKRSRREGSGPSGHWVYSPFRHGPHRCRRDDDIDGASQSDSDAPPCHIAPLPGSVIYTVYPDGSPAPQGTVIYGPPPPSSGRPVTPGTVIYGPPPLGTQFVSGPPPAHFTLPVIPAGVLHCNVSAHHNLEFEVARLEDIIDHATSRRQREKRTKARLADDIEELESRKQMLKKEVEDLHAAAQKHGRRDITDGHLDTLITELELERSLQHQDDLQDEIECIEKTLVKRRAELRQADRLLADAENQLKSTQGKTAELLEKCNMAKKHLTQTESDAEELERRAQETAVHLVTAEQQLRMLQASARDLEQHRAEQENILEEISSMVSAKEADFQSLTHKVQTLSNSLQKLQADLQGSEGREALHLKALKEAESLFIEKKMLLDRLNSEISVQQEEISELDRLLGQKKEDLHVLQERTEQRKAGLQELLQEGEMEVAERRQGIKEVRAALEDLGVQKEKMSAQLMERRSQLAALKLQVIQEEENLQKLSSQGHKQKSELQHTLEMQQLEDKELQGLKVQHEQKITELEETQALLLQGKLELEKLQRSQQRLHGEEDRQRQLLEKDQQEIGLLITQMHTLQDKVQILSREKDRLEESREELERKLGHTKTALAVTEENSRTASDALEKLHSEIKSLQSERTLLNKQKQSLRQETSTAQQALQETQEELQLLKDELAGLRDQLRVAEQQMQQREEQLRDAAASLEEQQQNSQNSLAQVCALEERAQKLQEEGRWCQDLEESLSGARLLLGQCEEQLQEKTNQMLALQEAAEGYRQELSSLREQLSSQRIRDEKRIMGLKDATASQRLQLQRTAEEHKLESSHLRQQLLTVEQAACDNHERAKRLLRELKQLQAEHAALQRQLRSQEELDTRQQEVNEAVKELKAQVKREIHSTLQDLHCATADQEEEELILEQSQSLCSQLESLREDFPFTANSTPHPAHPYNLMASQGHPTGEPRRGKMLREQLQEQEHRLKAQLQQRIGRQVAVLSRGRRQTEGSLHSLRKRVDALDELVSHTSSDSPFHSQNSSGKASSLAEERCSPKLHTSASLSPAGSQRPFCT